MTQPEEGFVPDIPIDVGYDVDCSENCSELDLLEEHRRHPQMVKSIRIECQGT